MIEFITPKAVELFNGKSASDRTIGASELYFMVMYHVADQWSDFTENGTPAENGYEDSQVSGSAVLMWIGEKGADLIATEDSFLMISSTTADTGIIKLYQISQINPNEDGFTTTIDSAWVANKIQTSDNDINYDDKVNLFAMGGWGNEHEIWMTNPMYSKFSPPEPVQLQDYIMRIRPLYRFEQIITPLPDISASLVSGGTDAILSVQASSAPLCFDGSTEIHLSSNNTADGASDSSTGNYVELELWRIGLLDGVDLLPNTGTKILTLSFYTNDPIGSAYWNMESTEDQNVYKQGLDGQYLWILPAAQADNIHLEAMIKDVSITLRVKTLNQFTDFVETNYN